MRSSEERVSSWTDRWQGLGTGGTALGSPDLMVQGKKFSDTVITGDQQSSKSSSHLPRRNRGRLTLTLSPVRCVADAAAITRTVGCCAT